jgi:hypothetical protein
MQSAYANQNVNIAKQWEAHQQVGQSNGVLQWQRVTGTGNLSAPSPSLSDIVAFKSAYNGMRQDAVWDAEVNKLFKQLRDVVVQGKRNLTKELQKCLSAAANA